jgi:hypothetical protein
MVISKYTYFAVLWLKPESWVWVSAQCLPHHLLRGWDWGNQINRQSYIEAIQCIQKVFTPLDFGDVIYKIASNTLLSKLDAVYHSAFCFVTKAPYTTHIYIYII